MIPFKSTVNWGASVIEYVNSCFTPSWKKFYIQPWIALHSWKFSLGESNCQVGHLLSLVSVIHRWFLDVFKTKWSTIMQNPQCSCLNTCIYHTSATNWDNHQVASSPYPFPAFHGEKRDGCNFYCELAVILSYYHWKEEELIYTLVPRQLIKRRSSFWPCMAEGIFEFGANLQYSK